MVRQRRETVPAALVILPDAVVDQRHEFRRRQPPPQPLRDPGLGRAENLAAQQRERQPVREIARLHEQFERAGFRLGQEAHRVARRGREHSERIVAVFQHL